jgi:Fur family ferric uptake transcriptional regulator
VILETVAHLGGHPTAHEVFQEARARLRGLNQATVYRNLDALHDAGLIDSIDPGTGQAGFAVRDAAHLHHHLVCSECGGVTEVPAKVLDRLAATLLQSHGFDLGTDHLTLVGRCRSCRSKGVPG